MHHFRLLALVASTWPIPLLLTPLRAQGGATELASLEAAARDDVAALLKVAQWADAQGLHTDARRLIHRVLTLAPDHEAANKAAGNVKHEGRWMTPAKADILRHRAQGLVFVGGVWVLEAEADDARAGVFHFQGERVSRAEYVELRAGKVRHPRTGELIGATDLEKAKNNMFPDGQGGWIDEAEANQRHANMTTPWVLRTKSTTVVGTMPLKELEQHANQYVDDAHDFAAGLFAGTATPKQRPVVVVAPTTDRFRTLGNDIGGAASAYGAFLAESNLTVPGLGSVQPAVALWDPNWGVYYLKHAVGVAVASSRGEGALPTWFVLGVGSYTERFYSAEIANWFGKQFLGAGGMLDLASWWRSAGVNAEMDHNQMGQQLYQAGLVIAFCKHGGDASAAKLLAAVGAALASGDPKTVGAAVAALEKGVQDRSDAVRAYLKTLTQS
jgi:hypothetical protein